MPNVKRYIEQAKASSTPSLITSLVLFIDHISSFFK
jgi:hypothetical protein